MILLDFTKDICMKVSPCYPQYSKLRLNKLYLVSYFDMEDKIIFRKTMFDQTLGYSSSYMYYKVNKLQLLFTHTCLSMEPFPCSTAETHTTTSFGEQN